MSEREFDKFLDILQRWHKDDYYTTADALGDARALFEAEHAKVSEPKLDTRAERAELQVSLLNALSDEMRATNKVNALILDRVRLLTAQGSLNCERLDRIESLYVPQIQEHVGIISAALENIGETQVVQRAALEGIQGLLVQLEHSFDVIAEVQANSYDAVVTKFEAIYKRLEPCKVCAGKRRVHALFERKTLENKATTVDEIMAAHDGRKPRKAGKRKRVKR